MKRRRAQLPMAPAKPMAQAVPMRPEDDPNLGTHDRRVARRLKRERKQAERHRELDQREDLGPKPKSKAQRRRSM